MILTACIAGGLTLVGLTVWLVVEIRMDRKTQQSYRVTTPGLRERLPPNP